MRLWQKIFLLTLFLTALAASAISLLLLARNHRNALLLAKEKVQTVRDSAMAQIGHLIQEEKDDGGRLLLTERELQGLFAEFCLASEEFRSQSDGRAFRMDSGEEREQAPARDGGKGAGESQKYDISIMPIETDGFSAAPYQCGNLSCSPPFSLVAAMKHGRRGTQNFPESRFSSAQENQPLG